MHFSGWMQQREGDTRRALARREDRSRAGHCKQCGELLDVKRIMASPGSTHCADCAFDSMPCTD
jgi:RNA polymerase-binding transcription factor DksA